jgi:membrane dipeptidase
VITADTHVDIDPANFRAGQPNYASGVSTQVDLPKMESGGLDMVFFSIFQGQGTLDAAGYKAAYDLAVAKVESIRRMTSELAPNRIGLATKASEVRSVAAQGKKVALMGMENGFALGPADVALANLRMFAGQGVRYLSLAHNGHSQLADSNTGERVDPNTGKPEGYLWNGLSPLGREVVAEANRLGVVLDISHPSKAANLELMRLSRAPVIASHSAVRSLADASRNLDDEQLRALKTNGGVVQVVAYSTYLRAVSPQRATELNALRQRMGVPLTGTAAIAAKVDSLPAAQRAEYDRAIADIDRRLPAPQRATVKDLVDHIDYVVKLIGIDHVGISSDFDGGGGVDGWNGAAETFNVTLELVRRGYTEEQIAKIWSGNLLRVMEAAERVAAEMGSH